MYVYENEEFYTADEIADMFKVKTQTVRTWAARGSIRSTHIPKVYEMVFTKAHVADKWKQKADSNPVTEGMDIRPMHQISREELEAWLEQMKWKHLKKTDKWSASGGRYTAQIYADGEWVRFIAHYKVFCVKVTDLIFNACHSYLRLVDRISGIAIAINKDELKIGVVGCV